MCSPHNNILTFAHTKSFTLIRGQVLEAVACSEAARHELLPGKCVGILSCHVSCPCTVKSAGTGMKGVSLLPGETPVFLRQ